MSAVLGPTSLSPTERSASVDMVEAFLRECVPMLTGESATAPTRGRPPILPALCLWMGLLVGVLRGFDSVQDLWRLFSLHGLWDWPRLALSDQAIYHRLARDGTVLLERLFEQISGLLAQRLEPFMDQSLAPFASGVYALDDSTLDQVARHLPALRSVPAGAAALLPGKLSGLFDLRRQQWARVVSQADPRQNEKVAARRMVEDLPAESLILADLGYFGFAWFDHLTNAGYWWVSRLRQNTSTVRLHTFYQHGEVLDALVHLGAHRADRAQHAVRLVQFRQHGTLRSYLTNVLDPRLLPLAEVARLYARRWDIELAFKLAKTHLGLHLLWGANPTVVLQQVWAVLIIAQILQALRLEIAARAGVDPFEVSMPLLVRWLPRLAARGLDPLTVFVEQGRQMRFIRPSTRTHILAPSIPPEELVPLPPGLHMERSPRYAQRNCGPRRSATGA